MLFNILALVSLLAVILLLRRFINIIPSVLACLIRWKESVNLDASVKLQRDRNFIALSMVIPFCLSCYRFGLYSPTFLMQFPDAQRLCITIAIFIAFILTRSGIAHLVQPRKRNPKAYRTAVTSSRTFFIMLTLCCLAAGGILAFFNVEEEHIRNAMIWLSATIYLIFLIRKTQIFCSSYTIFAAFLYLCALEILPTGLLIASAVIF